MSNKSKSVSKTTATGALGELAEQATRLEEARHWGDAAQVWQRIASHKNASKKTRAEAKGRAAAARVRAEAKSQDEPVATEVAPVDASAQAETPDEDTPAEAAIEDVPTAPEGAPDDKVASTPPASADRAPTGEPGAEGAPPAAPATVLSEESTSRFAALPNIGSVIQKRDRKGELRCECKVVDGGIEYKGVTYKSLSSAALAASKDLGLGASTLDGWSWWGLKKRDKSVQPSTKKDLGDALERAFAKYRERVTAIVKDASGDDLIKVVNVLKAQAAELVAMVEPGESSTAS